MYKKPLNKIRLSFLEGSFPENPLPFKRLNRRAFQPLKGKNRKSLTNRIKRVENRIVKRENLLESFKKNREKGFVTVDNVKENLFFTRGQDQQERVGVILTRKREESSYLFFSKKKEKCQPSFVTSKHIFSREQLLASLYKKQSKSKKSSSFKSLLQERKKLSLIYGGLGEKQIQKYADKAKRSDGRFDENFIKIVESRLDIALFRICFFPTVLSAKQWISHKHILVNKQRITLPGYQLRAGDLITVAPEKRKILKNKIKEFIAEKIKIRSGHYHSPLNTFYKILKRFYLSLFVSLQGTEKDYKKIQSPFVSSFPKGFKGKNSKILQSLSIFSKIFRKRSTLSLLKYRNLFTKGRPLAQRVRSFRITSMKPLNLEVCYKNMVAVFLYSPQKVAVPTSVDLYTIMRGS